jgi:hypothetical protein
MEGKVLLLLALTLRAIPYVAIPAAMVIAAVVFPGFFFAPSPQSDSEMAAKIQVVTHGGLLSVILLVASISILLFVHPVQNRINLNSRTRFGQSTLNAITDKKWLGDQLKIIAKLVIIGILLDAVLYLFLRLLLFPFLAGFHD